MTAGFSSEGHQEMEFGSRGDGGLRVPRVRAVTHEVAPVGRCNDWFGLTEQDRQKWTGTTAVAWGAWPVGSFLLYRTGRTMSLSDGIVDGFKWLMGGQSWQRAPPAKTGYRKNVRISPEAQRQFFHGVGYHLNCVPEEFVPVVAGQGVSLADAVSDGTETNRATVRKTPRKFREEFVAVLGEAVVDMLTDPKAGADRIRTCEYRSRAQFGAVVAPILEGRRKAAATPQEAAAFSMPACFQRALDSIKSCVGPARTKGTAVKYDDLILVNGLSSLAPADYELLAEKYEKLYGVPLSAVLATVNFVILNLGSSVDDMATKMGLVGPMEPDDLDTGSPYANASVMILSTPAGTRASAPAPAAITGPPPAKRTRGSAPSPSAANDVHGSLAPIMAAADMLARSEWDADSV